MSAGILKLIRKEIKAAVNFPAEKWHFCVLGDEIFGGKRRQKIDLPGKVMRAGCVFARAATLTGTSPAQHKRRAGCIQIRLSLSRDCAERR